MTLTINDLDNLQQHCENLSTLIKDIKKSYYPSNPIRTLFVSRSDYENSLKIKNQVPQDFYYFRCFDVLVQIVFDKKTEYYFLFVEGFYSHLLDKYKRNPRSDKSFQISKDFDTVLLLFQDVVNDVISNKVLQNGLF